MSRYLNTVAPVPPPERRNGGTPSVERILVAGGELQKDSENFVQLGFFTAGTPMNLSPMSKGTGVPLTSYVPAWRQYVVPAGYLVTTTFRLAVLGTCTPMQGVARAGEAVKRVAAKDRPSTSRITFRMTET